MKGYTDGKRDIRSSLIIHIMYMSVVLEKAYNEIAVFVSDIIGLV